MLEVIEHDEHAVRSDAPDHLRERLGAPCEVDVERARHLRRGLLRIPGVLERHEHRAIGVFALHLL